MKRSILACFAPLFALICQPHPALAQTIAGCTAEVRRDPPRQVFVCVGGLIIEADAAARLTFFVASPQAAPHAVGLEAGAVLIELDPVHADPGASGFQIRTPHAIASVRGTLYTVDVTAGASAVFVQRGEVSVAERTSGRRVRVGPGQGVDVVPANPPKVRTWGAGRVADLLARFGR